MIKKFVWILLIAIAYSIGLSVGSHNPDEDLYPHPKIIREDTIYTLIQGFRVISDLKPYVKSDRLCEIAQLRLTEIQKNFSHDGFDADRFCQSGCKFGENLAEGYNDEQLLLDAWLVSASHSANLHADYSKTCIKTDGNYVVQIFGDI